MRSDRSAIRFSYPSDAALYTDQLGLEEVGVTDQWIRGFRESRPFQTSVEGIYANRRLVSPAPCLRHMAEDGSCVAASGDHCRASPDM